MELGGKWECSVQGSWHPFPWRRGFLRSRTSQEFCWRRAWWMWSLSKGNSTILMCGHQVTGPGLLCPGIAVVGEFLHLAPQCPLTSLLKGKYMKSFPSAKCFPDCSHLCTNFTICSISFLYLNTPNTFVLNNVRECKNLLCYLF